MNKTSIFLKTCFLAVAMCAAAVAANAQQFVIERGTEFLSFATLNAAVGALQDGDKIYIPPGLHGGTSGEIIFDVPNITIIGAGYANSVNASQFGRPVYFNADGITVTGIAFVPTGVLVCLTLGSISNLTMTRCLFIADVSMTSSSIQNSIFISECEFRGRLGGSSNNLDNATISKSILGTLNVRTSIIENCLFLTYPEYNLIASYSDFNNNIFIMASGQSGVSNITNATFNNNLFVRGTPTFSANSDVTFNASNITDAVYEDTFNDPDAGDYSLKAGSAGIGAGNDGTDIGLFGTAVPFKKSKLPAIPHFSLRSIAPETDETGNLRVKIIVEAQER